MGPKILYVCSCGIFAISPVHIAEMRNTRAYVRHVRLYASRDQFRSLHPYGDYYGYAQDAHIAGRRYGTLYVYVISGRWWSHDRWYDAAGPRALIYYIVLSKTGDRKRITIIIVMGFEKYCPFVRAVYRNCGRYRRARTRTDNIYVYIGYTTLGIIACTYWQPINTRDVCVIYVIIDIH